MGRARLRGAKTKYHHGDLRQALLESAATVLDIRGLAALTLREVARRAGVSEAAPYRHFDGLSALLEALREESFDMLLADLRVAGGRRSQAKSYLSFAVDYPGRYRLMFTNRKIEAQATDPDSDRSTEIVAALGGDQGLFAMLHGCAMLAIEGFIHPNAEELSGEVVSAP